MYKVYQVRPGETIEIIANNLGISVEEISRLNNLNEVVENDLIVIPNDNMYFDIYTIKKGDNLYEIARKYNITLEDLTKLNGLNKDDFIYPNQQILIPKSEYSIYITNESDDISSITDKLGINSGELLKENNLYLVPDQLIIYRR